VRRFKTNFQTIIGHPEKYVDAKNKNGYWRSINEKSRQYGA
jgi:hypothetical protein